MTQRFFVRADFFREHVTVPRVVVVKRDQRSAITEHTQHTPHHIHQHPTSNIKYVPIPIPQSPSIAGIALRYGIVRTSCKVSKFALLPLFDSFCSENFDLVSRLVVDVGVRCTSNLMVGWLDLSHPHFLSFSAASKSVDYGAPRKTFAWSVELKAFPSKEGRKEGSNKAPRRQRQATKTGRVFEISWTDPSYLTLIYKRECNSRTVSAGKPRVKGRKQKPQETKPCSCVRRSRREICGWHPFTG